MSVDQISEDTNSKVKKNIEKSVVPWYNTSQFKKVYEYLFSTEVVKKRWAVDQISVWETRCHLSLPTAIEASLVIVRAIIQDVLWTNEASLCQECDIRMMYSMALVRFVNLTIEVHYDPVFGTTRKMSEIAKGCGIPSWIVDLRNEATHSFNPSLSSLRMAAEAAMKFLNESFWEKEISALKNLEKKPSDEKICRELISSYITLNFNIVKGEREMEFEQCNPDVKKIKLILSKLYSYIVNNKREFINIFISDGLFIPYDDDLKNVMSPVECLKYEQTFDEAYENRAMSPAELSIPVPLELQNLWKRMILMLNYAHAIRELLEALLKSLAERSEMGKKLIIAWVIKLVDGEGNIRKLFRHQSLILDWRELFIAAVFQPCIYTPYIFGRFGSQLDLKKGVVANIAYLLSIAIGHADWDSEKLPNGVNPVRTVDDLKQMKKLQNAKKEKSKEESIWFVAEGSSYKSWPIGFVSHPVDDTFKAEDQPDDIPEEYFEEKMDFIENYFILNKNDNEEEDFGVNQLSISEDEMEISERRTFLYKMK